MCALFRGDAVKPVSAEDAAFVSKSAQDPPDQLAQTYDARPLAEWLEVMKSLDFQSPAAAEAVPGLLQLVQDQQLPWYTRRQAALTLGRIGRPAQDAVPVLERLLASPPDSTAPSAAAWAAKALSLFGPFAAPATPALARVLGDQERPHLDRLSCVEALGRIGGAHEEAIPALIRLADAETDRSNDAAELREAAVDGLALVGSAAAPAVPTLIRLSREDGAVRLQKSSVVALGRIGPAAGIAAQSLAELVLFDESPEVRAAAAVALATIGEPGEAALCKLLTDEDRAVRRLAAEALARVAQRTGPVVAALTSSLQDADAAARIAAAESLWKLTREGEPVFPTILDTLTNEDRLLRIRAYRLLRNISQAPEAVLQELRRLAEDDRRYVRQIAEKALRDLDDLNGSRPPETP